MANYSMQDARNLLAWIQENRGDWEIICGLTGGKLKYEERIRIINGLYDQNRYDLLIAYLFR